MRGIWRIRHMWSKISDWLDDEIAGWRGYTAEDVASLKHKIETSLPGAVVWLTDTEINALRRVDWPDELGILAWHWGEYKVVRSPHSRQRGVIFPPREVVLG